MAQAKIKKEFLDKRLAFGKNANPLYKRTGDEINEIAILALESKDKSLLKLFEKIPPLAELKKSKTDLQLKKVAEVVAKKSK